jgi:hypothetical protein
VISAAFSRDEIEGDYVRDTGQELLFNLFVLGMGQVAVAGLGVAKGHHEAMRETLIQPLGTGVGAADLMRHPVDHTLQPR